MKPNQNASPRAMDFGGIDPRFVGYLNMPIGAIEFSPLQLIEKLANQEVQKSWLGLFHFLMPSAGLLMLIAAGCLLYSLSSALFSYLKKLKSGLSMRNLQTKIMAIFFLLFLFLIGQIFQGNLNTENVMVQTDDLLYSTKQIFATQKEPCFFEKSIEMEVFRNAPPNSLLTKIFEKRNKSDTCYIISGSQFGNFIGREKGTFFILVPHKGLDFLVRLVQTFARRDTYIEMSLEVYQGIRTFAIRKDLPIELRKWGEAYIALLSENGFIKKCVLNIPNYIGIKFEKRGKDGFMHYEGLQDYIAENTRVKALPFDKLDYLFRLYFALGSALLLVNLLHYHLKRSSFPGFFRLFRLAKRKLAALKRRIKRRRKRKGVVAGLKKFKLFLFVCGPAASKVTPLSEIRSECI